MSEFGAALRRLRTEAGLRQQDVSDRLAGNFARSTLANVESGRERPSARLWKALQEAFPGWTDLLAPTFESGRAPSGGPAAAEDSFLAEVGGPFAIEEVSYVYTWRDHRAPEEIIEVRRVRALRDGAATYGLRFNSDSESFEMETEALWGGYLDSALHLSRAGNSLYLSRFGFDRTLQRGERHSFAVRSWVARDDEPDHSIVISFTLPVARATIHLNYLGPVAPVSFWSYGPLADELLIPDSPVGGAPLRPLPNRSVTATFPHPVRGSKYGLSWAWAD